MEVSIRPFRMEAKLGSQTQAPPSNLGFVVTVSWKLCGVAGTQVATVPLPYGVPYTPRAPPLDVVPCGQAVQRLQGSRLQATKPRRTDADRAGVMAVP